MKKLFVTILFLYCVVSMIRGESLKQVLLQNRIPLGNFSESELLQDVSSSASSGTIVFLLAYPSVDKSNFLHPPLHILRYDHSQNKLIHRDLSPPELNEECDGSALDVSEHGEHILIVTHINPSASCTIILDQKLQIHQTLFAWPVVWIGRNRILLEEDQIHFANVHSMRLKIVNLADGTMKEIYPPQNDELRDKFSTDLKRHMPSQQWCRENNIACDPDRFDEDFNGPVAVNTSNTLFAFIATYDADGFGEEADREIVSHAVLYVYREHGTSWSYCEQELADSEIQNIKIKLKSDLNAITATCTDTHPVKVAPVESPFDRLK